MEASVWNTSLSPLCSGELLWGKASPWEGFTVGRLHHAQEAAHARLLLSGHWGDPTTPVRLWDTIVWWAPIALNVHRALFFVSIIYSTLLSCLVSHGVL